MTPTDLAKAHRNAAIRKLKVRRRARAQETAAEPVSPAQPKENIGMFNSIIMSVVMGQLRTALASLAGAGITAGLVTQDEATTLVSAAVILATAIWSGLSKKLPKAA